MRRRKPTTAPAAIATVSHPVRHKTPTAASRSAVAMASRLSHLGAGGTSSPTRRPGSPILDRDGFPLTSVTLLNNRSIDGAGMRRRRQGGRTGATGLFSRRTSVSCRPVKVLPLRSRPSRKLRGNPVPRQGNPELTRNCERRAAAPRTSLAYVPGRQAQQRRPASQETCLTA